MTEPTRLVQLPEPTTTTLIVLVLCLVGMVIAAVLLERQRRSGWLRKRSSAKWKTVEDIILDRQLSKDEAAALRRMVSRHAPDDPAFAVTTREGFERCVEAELAEARDDRKPEELASHGMLLREIRAKLGLDTVPVGQRIHSTRELQPGQILVAGLAEKEKPTWYTLMVEDVDELFLHVSKQDRRTSETPDWVPGTRLRCRLWHDEDARYVYETRVDGYDAASGMWRFEHTRVLERVQARQHFRLRVDVPAVFGLLDARAAAGPEALRDSAVVGRLRGKITSLSAGGCALVVSQALTKGAIVRVPVQVFSDEPFDADAEIVAITPISGQRYFARARFVGIEEEHQERIAQYVFRSQQRALRSR